MRLLLTLDSNSALPVPRQTLWFNGSESQCPPPGVKILRKNPEDAIQHFATGVISMFFLHGNLSCGRIKRSQTVSFQNGWLKKRNKSCPLKCGKRNVGIKKKKKKQNYCCCRPQRSSELCFPYTAKHLLFVTSSVTLSPSLRNLKGKDVKVFAVKGELENCNT